VSAVCFCEMGFLGMCSSSWFGTGAVVGDVVSSIWEVSVLKVLLEGEATVVVGVVAGSVIVRGETAVDGNGAAGVESMMLQVLLCTR
jgi:hypothetical protein